MKGTNKEVQFSLNALFFDYLTKLGKRSTLKSGLAKLLLKVDMDGVRNHLHALFAAIPNTNYIKNNIARFEGYYASVIYALVCSLGFDVRAEDYTNAGRVDMALIGPDQVFIVEFKVDQPSETATIPKRAFGPLYDYTKKRWYSNVPYRILKVLDDKKRQPKTGYDYQRKQKLYKNHNVKKSNEKLSFFTFIFSAH